MICGRKRGLRWCKLSGQESRWSGRLSIIASQFMTCSMVLSFTISQSSLLFPFSSSLLCSVYSSLDGTLHCGLNVYWLVQKRSINYFNFIWFVLNLKFEKIQFLHYKAKITHIERIYKNVDFYSLLKLINYKMHF
jgi:hypothetical protein